MTWAVGLTVVVAGVLKFPNTSVNKSPLRLVAVQRPADVDPDDPFHVCSIASIEKLVCHDEQP